MFRQIVGFHQDELGDWVAELVCLHNQHVRHKPPFQIRPWVIDDVERNSRIGTLLDCSLCDRCELPDEINMQSVVGRWDSESIPRGLLSSHKLGKGKWAIITVVNGNVDVELQLNPPIRKRLSRGESQSIPPEVSHNVALQGDAEFELAIWSR